MRWTSDFTLNIVGIFLFAIALGLGFYFLSERKAASTWASFWIAWCLLGGWVAIYLHGQIVIEPAQEGVLKPGNERVPNALKIPANAIAVLFAGGTAWTIGNSFTVLKLAGRSVLSVERTREGLLINAEVFSPNGQIVAEIQKNAFLLNPNNYFRKVRPDWHTLRILDLQNQEVLNVDFINGSYVRIDGIFSSSGQAVRATPDFLGFGKGNKLRVYGMQVGEGTTAYSF